MNGTPFLANSDLCIKSLNCHRSYEVLISLLNDCDPRSTHIICVQEPPPTLLRFPSLSPHLWDRILPSGLSAPETQPKALCYISKQLSSSQYSQLPVDDSNVVCISFESSANNVPFRLYNIYNPPDSNTAIESLACHLEPLLDEDTSLEERKPGLLLMGDFNKHHPLWSGPPPPRAIAAQ